MAAPGGERVARLTRGRVFDDAVAEGLRAEEFAGLLGRTGSPTQYEQALRTRLEAEIRDEEAKNLVLDGAADAEANYAAARRWRRLRPWFVASVAFVAVTCFGAAVLVGWSVAKEDALKEKKALLMTELGKQTLLAVITGVVIISIIVGIVVALTGYADYVEHSTEDEWPVALALVFAPGAALGFASQDLAWIYDHNAPSNKDTDAYPWGWWVFLTVTPILMGAVLAAFHLDRARFRGRVGETAQAWRDAVSRALLGNLREALNRMLVPQYGTVLRIGAHDAAELQRVRATPQHSRTSADDDLRAVTHGMDGGSIALAGPRGVGKSQLLRTFCSQPSVLGIQVSAPVVHDRREFMLHLFTQVCEATRHPALARLHRPAQRHLREIRFLQTVGGETGWEAGWKSVKLARKRSVSSARQPLSYPEIVHALCGFLAEVSDEARRHSLRLVVGVDELDRIHPPDKAAEFLNELKAVFDVPHCLFVITASDEALRSAGLGRGKDAFDSAIDETIRLSPLDLGASTLLLSSRVIGLPVPFTALFNILAGGIPRDLLRTARAGVSQVSRGRGQGVPLAEMTGILVARELVRLSGASDGRLPDLIRTEAVPEYGPLRLLGERVLTQAAPDALVFASHLFRLDTVCGIFAHRVNQTTLTSDEHGASLDDLAHTRDRIGQIGGNALTTVAQVRRHWSLDRLPDWTHLPDTSP
ncbi:hypothetical protein GCM10027589_04890 [Actinocorallia lasiicapitis]